MDLYFPPVFNAEYYKRRWTIRFCILGLTMFLLTSSSLVSMKALLHYSKFTNATVLLSVTPFFLHSLQLVSAVVLLRSGRKDIQYLNRCQRWSSLSWMFLPSIFFELFILFMWKFDTFMILLTVCPYVIGVVKTIGIIEKDTALGIIRIARREALRPVLFMTLDSRSNNEQYNILPVYGEREDFRIFTATNIFPHSSHDETKSSSEENDDYLPTYFEALLQQENTESSLLYCCPPPNYDDVCVT